MLIGKYVWSLFVVTYFSAVFPGKIFWQFFVVIFFAVVFPGLWRHSLGPGGGRESARTGDQNPELEEWWQF